MHASRPLSEEPPAQALLPVVLLGLLLLGLTGCATTERQQLLERSAAYVSYRLPSEQILEVAHEVLKERGYLILPSTDPNYVRTSWLTKFDETLDVGAVRERHFVMGKQLDNGRFVLTAYRLSYTTIGRTSPHPSSPKANETTGVQAMIKGDPLSYARPVLVRDLELEWEILSRVSPSVAHELESQVDQYLAEEHHDSSKAGATSSAQQ
ncbi:hypothetical protein [Vitiosangium sp. GDMCC 1.1324]|uniref:hypothetical protein n=1 Tax=Vitiosangium sp. (strain GDMCC 1.1324) TaxID=2138576 RepID=UPI000D36B389|nr:hypothetical protein [Vitiosangium sp. GDMCC 1.1324]PTL77458.1 hypothetical protein DAT35_44455 [Vitiosangium sp. GDMCC 1.1324]